MHLLCEAPVDIHAHAPVDLTKSAFGTSPERALVEQDLETIERVGEGITSVVFRGVFHGMPVAIKEMKRDAINMTQKACTNLAREIAILQKVNHPALVRFVGVAEGCAKVKLVTEYCFGGTAFDLIHNSELILSWRQKIKMSYDVAIGMEYLHACNPPIIHRDLKSLNLLLSTMVNNTTDMPAVKITDFGLSRMVDVALEGQQVMTQNAGTYQWMAPEVFCSNSYSREVDVYSFAMILYEVICQEIPFQEIPAAKLGLAVCQGERPDLDEIPPVCPAYLYDMMIASWAHDPAERPDFTMIVQALRTGKF